MRGAEPDIPRRKVPFTAAVLVPPRELWPPIQAIRREHDEGVGRWMPHITLLYPFVPRECLPRAAEKMREGCAQFLPFRLRLGEFDRFEHGARRATLWLRPEPCEIVGRLQSRLVEMFPWCDDTSRYEGGYTPHMSVGQWPLEAAQGAQEELESGWDALAWRVRRVCLIGRAESGGEPFEIEHELPLGTAAEEAESDE